MVGAASESLVLEIRDELVKKMIKLGIMVPSGLKKRRIKTIRDEVEKCLVGKKMNHKLYERFSSFWVPLTDQIRISRNDAGHPVSIDPVTHEAVHASLLLFPELARLVKDLKKWIRASYS